MSENYIMLDGRKIEISYETAKNLREQFKPEKKFGDIVTYKASGIRRILLYDEDGKLKIYSKDGNIVSNGKSDFYIPTGENIFKDDYPLDLDS